MGADINAVDQLLCVFKKMYYRDCLFEIWLPSFIRFKLGDGNGWTSLHWAAQQNRVDVTCILLRHGANRRAKDCHGHMPYEVTTNAEMSEALRPDAFYPQIESNGAVSTDEEEASASESSSDEADGGDRKVGAMPSYHYLRRLNYNRRNRHQNRLRTHLSPTVEAPTQVRLAHDDEDGCLGAAKA
ncbi:unnamed protein product [Hydatigera taeniaeformis]|uniref:ANK_REP_REGION domain-containing protein n=1 Tax=Hydatigena taeniaeformis TaxID=6205 RepID=A0A0R3WK21_HYDTA|nr:unnamed protein product [Hydatigera taeniaeformis]